MGWRPVTLGISLQLLLSIVARDVTVHLLPPPQKGTERILPMASDAAARGRTPQRHGGGRAHAGSTMFGRADVEWLADVGGGGDLAS